MFDKIQHFFDTVNQKGGVVLVILVVCVAAYFLITKKSGNKYRKQLFGTRKIEEQGTDIPLDGDLLPAYFILENQERIFPGSGNLLHAYFVRWILEGRIEIRESVPDQPYTVYIFPEKGTPEGEYEKWEFKDLKKAADPDLMLTRYKCYKWGQDEHVAHCDRKEQQILWFEKHHFVQKEKLVNVILTPEGAAEARKVVALENYLNALIAGTATVEPDPDRIAYYIQFAILCDKWKDFKIVLPKYKDACARLAELLKCSPDKVVNTIEDACLTIEQIDEGDYDANDSERD
ncbi:MAG: hypothetical protein IKX53_01415 [Bacteroidales bacterium]|nr:hypothetical protein [Bacteroidales bacterium]